MGIFSKILGDANKRAIEKLRPLVESINKLEPQFERFSFDELRAETEEFKKRLAEGESLDDILPEAFAAVREASKRTLGQRHFDVQLMGGIVLHQGKIAEMKTGEGKTLVATLPVYLNALTGHGVHIITVNDYLSRRDTVWMGQIYHLLGLSVGCLNHEASYIYDPLHRDDRIQDSKIRNQNDNVKIKDEEENVRSKKLDEIRDTTGSFKVVHEFLRPVTRREAYEADITYGTNNEFGFDYLRDNMAYDLSQIVQVYPAKSGEAGARPVKSSPKEFNRGEQFGGAGGHNFAIVDEVDSILIDEARTPLIISAPDAESTKLYETFAKIVPRLEENSDYNVDEKLRAVSVTEKGIEKVENLLGLKNIYEEGGTRYVHHLEQALKAHILFHRDKDYVVKNGEVIIVDEFTGRLMPGRRWSEGLHQAIEAKEGVYIQKESRTLATITFQNYFRLYKKLAGMTGTAQTSAEEFHKVYNLEVVTIPTNKPMIRVDLPDKIFKTETGKFKALAREIKERHLKGQPVLVGTVSITKNEILSALLEREGVPHKVLNAKNHEQEGEIIAQAGRIGAVTVATNMAGRGVDIILGGNPPDPAEALKIVKLGGLHVIGTERHEARRIDNQLRGRSGRQGDPGSSQFFVSTEDELVRIFAGERLKNLMERLGVGEDDVIENQLISRAIEQAQSKIEGNNFDIRKYVLEYDDVMNKHRTAIYQLRKEILESEGARERVISAIYHEIERIVDFHAAVPLKQGVEADIEEIAESFKAMIPLEDNLRPRLREIAASRDPGRLADFLKKIVDDAYLQREKQLGAETMRGLERILFLRVIDELWVDHLEQMEYLRDSVRLRAYGQRDPLVEYKIEGQKMFNQLQAAVNSQIANLIFKVSFIQKPTPAAVEEKREDWQLATSRGDVSSQMEQEASSRGSAVSGPKVGQPVVAKVKVGRNDPCPCGAKKPDGRPVKYKHCHGKNL
jgi:preprotein translocase subunit SecA